MTQVMQSFTLRVGSGATRPVDGTFLGGKETRDGGTFVYDKDWNVVSSSKAISSDVKSLGRF